jgi:hypothetical protein
MAALKAPVTDPLQYSSQPMDGGLAQGSPSISTPLAYAALPALRQGELALRCEVLASWGAAVRLPVPAAGRGVVQQYFGVPL